MLKKRSLLTLAILYFWSSNSFATLANTKLYFTPASLIINQGQDFSITAVIDPSDNQVSGVEINITYDQNKFRLDNVSPSSIFPSGLVAASIDNTNGIASIGQGVSFGSSVVTSSNIATFSFHSLAPATDSYIDFTLASVVVSNGVVGNVIETITPASVTVNASAITPDGDINADGIVNVIDVLRALRITIGLSAPTPEDLLRGDVAPLVTSKPLPDGNITVGDALLILRKSVGLVSW